MVFFFPHLTCRLIGAFFRSQFEFATAIQFWDSSSIYPINEQLSKKFLPGPMAIVKWKPMIELTAIAATAAATAVAATL